MDIILQLKPSICIRSRRTKASYWTCGFNPRPYSGSHESFEVKLPKAWMNDFLERGNYHIWAYFSFIWHKTMCRREVTFFGWFDTKISFQDLRLECCSWGHLRSINNIFIEGQGFMWAGQKAHFYTIVPSLHALPSSQLSCMYQVSCSRCSPLKGGNIPQISSNPC